MKRSSQLFVVLAAIVHLCGCAFLGKPKPPDEISAMLSAAGLSLTFVYVIPESTQDEYRGMTLTSYALSTTEVTVADWETVMGGLPFDETEVAYTVDDEHPVTGMTWLEATVFCNALSELIGLRPVYGNVAGEPDHKRNGFYMPTEAQWEYAAGGSEHYAYGLGNAFVPEDYIYDRGADEGPDSVISTTPNDFGLYGMSGNAAEWCDDYFDDTYPDAYDGVTDPAGPEDGFLKVVRGGSWLSLVQTQLEVTARGSAGKQSSSSGTGFRVCLGGFGKW